MKHVNLRPLNWENTRFDLGIKIIIKEMLSDSVKVIHNYVKKFLEAGGELKSLTLSHHADGTIILRSDERTVVTVKIQIEGRKFRKSKFKVAEESS